MNTDTRTILEQTIKKTYRDDYDHKFAVVLLEHEDKITNLSIGTKEDLQPILKDHWSLYEYELNALSEVSAKANQEIELLKSDNTQLKQEIEKLKGQITQLNSLVKECIQNQKGNGSHKK